MVLWLPLSAAGQSADSLVACRAIAAGDERLACYDRVVDRARAELAPREREHGAPATAEVARGTPELPSAAESGFGRSAQTAETMRRLYGVEEADSLAGEVAALRKGGDRTLEITLTNRQTWRQKDSTAFSLKVGDRVQIERGALGSYYLRREQGGRRIAVKRVQ